MPHVRPHQPHDPDQPRRGDDVWHAHASEALVHDTREPRPARRASQAARAATPRGLWGSREERSAALVDEPAS